MAYNSWDKLSKAQRDFPKPKFAHSVVTKALKKQPHNPFLLCWMAELSLTLDQGQDALLRLNSVCDQGPTRVTDTRFLAYMYKICAETLRCTDFESDSVGSIGNKFLAPWQAAVKATQRKSDRLQIWDTLFTTAIREDCWDDVQYAVVNYQKEGLSDKKQIHYIRILVTHLAAQQKRDRLKKDDQMTQIQFKVARGQLKQAFQASPDDPIAIKDIRDLRFMAEIYARQGHCSELIELWKAPPQSLVGIMRTYHDELMDLIARLLKRGNYWELLEAHCLEVIGEVSARLKDTGDTKEFQDFCASRGHIWSSLLKATRTLYSPSEALEKLKSVVETFTKAFEQDGRPIQRTSMMLLQAIGTDMLSVCQRYWECHSTTPSCFHDLLPHVACLSMGQQQEFHRFIQDQTRHVYAKADLDEAKYAQWQLVELNVLKFDYLLTISMNPSPTIHALDSLAKNAIRYCFQATTEGAFVAIYTLLNLHYESSVREDCVPCFEVAPSTRFLLQATMLARHVAARNKEDRTMSILAARLHLNLGLGKSAFQFYRQSNLKEMLLDTLSLYTLSRISMTHPFEVKGYQGFSADEELAKVIGTIERMERKADTFIYTDLPSFIYDQFPDVLSVKRRLQSSLTRQLCITERRRIARLKGQSTEQIPRLSQRTLTHISDNTERSPFPHYDCSSTNGLVNLVMPNPVPNETWKIFQSFTEERASQVLYREEGLHGILRWLKASLNKASQPPWGTKAVSAELILHEHWEYLAVVAVSAKSNTAAWGEQTHIDFHHRLQAIRKGMQSLRLRETTALKPEDEPTMFSEHMLLACYTKLELLRAIYKFIGLLQESVFHAKSTHPLKKELPEDFVSCVASETELCFKAIQDVAQSYITVIRKRGMAAIKAQVRWGATGEQLCQHLTAEDVQYYANEYVESAVEGWSGVLKVKLS
ncbi:hypothetical protein T440DRAFT_551750 [Plenodomus tracheiphilus IPT5]|uniref:Uncharacterized protein n=1 Tax=Plenodomus tracheiphilus IPT5 TaxID=1408161 RepID=A0A6A7BJP4_9PLEO|nr:hypothetical protein T440DRAFT_551750 [Plenodomus tracheiphilus IPT5]